MSEWVRVGPIDERFEAVAPATSFTIGTVNVPEDEVWEIVLVPSIDVTYNRGSLFLYYYYVGLYGGFMRAWDLTNAQPSPYWVPAYFPGGYEVRVSLTSVVAEDVIRCVLTGWRWKEKVE